MEPDIECGGFTFVSNFDSGNLARVELVPKTTDGNANATGKVSPADDVPDFEFNIWTKPDCAGTEYENSNRTWFYFGIKGGAPFSLVKLNIVNLNKQSKMYSQGMAPVYRMIPGRAHWERIKDKPTYVSEDNVFILSFKYRTLENLRAVTYFAFTYPYSYLEVQNMLKGIDARFKNLEDEPRLSTSLDDIYYHRECVCHSLEGRRIDLITISSRHLMGTEREPRLKNLFPDPSTPRPFRFLGKKVIFISARVHPGETPSSFVFNGLLNLLLSRDDTIAILLRKLYVFKLIPVLNPDGVARGHYRTDTRGVNLNRVYLNPSSVLHPSVFAARSLIRYYHHGREVEDETPEILCYPTDKLNMEDDDGAVHSSEGPALSSTESSSPVHKDVLTGDSSCLQSDENKVPNVENQVTLVTVEEKKHENQVPLINADKVSPLSENPRTLFEYPQAICQENNNVFAAIRETLIRTVTGFCDVNSENVNNATISVKAEGLPDKALIIEGIPHHNCVTSLTSSSEVLTPNSHNKMKPTVEPEFDAELENQSPSSILLCENKDNSGPHFGDLNCGSAQSEANNKISYTGISKTIIEPEESGLFLYIDLHGHASKKGIFMYGNHFENIADGVECMLLPKIMSLNNPNFHFTACNFTERNMYLRDRRDGMSREGSGRVAVLKTTGLVRSYTLECNYNTGRIVNVLPPCVKDCSKPVSVHVVPPKYSPQVFEEVGRALGISILDLTGSNPWSRIPNSEFRTLSGIREWLKTNCIPEQICSQKVLRNQKQMGMPPTNAQVVCVAGARAIRPSSSGSGSRVRITGSKQDCSYGRNRRLAPLMSKTSDSKLSRLKVPSSNGIAVLCTLEKADDDSENTEDSERKENMSTFQIISPPQSPSNSRLTKAFSGPKEKSGCGSSQRCSETSKKYLGNQSTNNCVLKQVLTVRTKCAPIGPLAGSSKSKLNTNLRMQKISSVGPAGVQRKGNSSLSASGGRISKFRRGSLLKSSREGSLGHSSDAETFIGTDVPSVGGRKVERKGSKQGSLVSARAGTSNEKVKYTKDERSVSDQLIIKQGPKRLKITPLKNEQHSDLIGIGKLKLKDICLVNVGHEKKLLAKYAHIDEPTNMIDDIASETFSEEDLIISWDENQQPEIVSFGCSQQNSPHVKSKIVHKKSASVSSIPKSSNLIVGTSKSEIQGPGPSVKVKYSTKSEKQNKNKGSHLSPIKPLKKSSSFGKKINSEKKRSKVSLRNLASSVSKFRGSGNSESGRSLSVEKKRMKSKSKFS
ncbi:cytosolic carboxypeptidase-like protein 5 isoform X2 [Anabrus simplex]|uniref:cytosolic carboxypeptidase-like protein 5 isoform X2 n=1 Tax=Anabrus simplex TaxID=316456 RepID=UPI0035A262A0